MNEFKYMYLIMMKTLDYERSHDCLTKFHRYMVICLESQDAEIMKRVVQVV